MALLAATSRRMAFKVPTFRALGLGIVTWCSPAPEDRVNRKWLPVWRVMR